MPNYNIKVEVDGIEYWEIMFPEGNMLFRTQIKEGSVELDKGLYHLDYAAKGKSGRTIKIFKNGEEICSDTIDENGQASDRVIVTCN